MLSPIRASNNPQLLDMLPFKDELATAETILNLTFLVKNGLHHMLCK